MSLTALLETPEFLIAAFFGLLLLRLPQMKGGMAGSIPQWIAGPALSALVSLPRGYGAWLQRTQIWAGWRSNTAFGELASIKIYGSIFLLLAGLVLPLWSALLIAALFFFAADAALLWAARRRQKEIRESMPQALDLMVLCVDAGLGLDATLQRIASERSAIAKALNEELLTLGKDVLLGMDRERAYQELYARTGVDELRSLGSSLNQSTKLGLSIARVLRTQSEFLRTKLSQKAEERAAKLPIYMAFPLWFCIMPALMVVLLAPSVIMFLQQLNQTPLAK
ncbi:MAG TPA: type II secretion system F family protein [Candidatus Obscuribacterales bacterium]